MTERFTISYSSRGTLRTCARRFEFQKLYPRRKGNPADEYPADVGKALHTGIQSYVVNKDSELATFDFMRKFPFETEFMQKNDYRGFEASLATLELMFETFDTSDYEVAKIRRPNTPEELKAGLTGGVVVPAVEVPFEIRLQGLNLPDGRGISYNGYMDLILQHKYTGRFKTTDVKTSRFKVNDATAKFKFDTQQTPYGIIVDHVAGIAVGDYDVIYLDAWIDLLEPECKIYEFKRNANDVQEWLMNLVMDVKQVIRYAETDYFPRTDHGCMMFNQPCRFLNVCESRDRNALNQWFAMEELANPEAFFPWVVADIELGAYVNG